MVNLEPFPPPLWSLETNTHLQMNTAELLAPVFFL